jgi:hypothetical protein
MIVEVSEGNNKFERAGTIRLVSGVVRFDIENKRLEEFLKTSCHARPEDGARYMKSLLAQFSRSTSVALIKEAGE